MDEEERARRRVQASAFVAEERSVREATPPFDVAGLRAPLVYGRSDPPVMAPVVDHLCSRVEAIELATLPGAGHYAHRTAPEAFAGLVRRGLDLAQF
jgi:pimeloyl-ACP methyl ester carboxylesterase